MARLNRNIVVYLICIWTVAIFGFQIALRVLEKPTPEPAYLEFEQVWEQVLSGTTNQEVLQRFSRVSLSVLGKNFIDPVHRQALDNGLSHSLYTLAGPEADIRIQQQVADFEKLTGEIENITNPDYVKAKKELASNAASILGLSEQDVRTTLISIELHASMMDELSADSKAVIPAAMSRYLIHNQSILTDGRIFGFPFHYFYSSIFLLVLFVGLCWLYCVRADRRDTILGIEN